MDAAGYKHHTVSRGLTYNFYYYPAQPTKPTIIFLHGFPSSSSDWRDQVKYFQPQGFGIVVPDMLGYAGTVKPIDSSLYVESSIVQDIVDILDFVDVKKAIVIGHDWGSFVASRIANIHPDRAIAFAFFAVEYIPPLPLFAPVPFANIFEPILGPLIFGCWIYFSEKDTDKELEKHFDSFFSLLFPNDPMLWAKYLIPPGATKGWIESDKRVPLPSYVSEEEKKHYKNPLLNGGFAAPLCWYEVQTSGQSGANDKKIPAEAYYFSQPAFFGACTKDFVCPPQAGIAMLKKFAKGPVTIEEFVADHWILMSNTGVE